MWGFDPIADRLDAFPFPYIFYYDTYIPLENDPELKKVGVVVHARVCVDEERRSHNRIVLKQTDVYAEVECVHTAVYRASVDGLIGIPEEDLKDLVTSTEGQPAILPSWEHFAALKSFLGGIASIGFLNIFDSAGYSGENGKEMRKIGLDPRMMDQIKIALLQVAPTVMIPRIMPEFCEFVDRMPAEDLKRKWDEVEFKYNASAFLKDVHFVKALDHKIWVKLIDIYLDLLNHNQLEGEEYNIFPSLLSRNFLEKVPLLLQNRIMDSLYSLARDFDCNLKLKAVITPLFLDALSHEESKLLHPQYLSKIITCVNWYEDEDSESENETVPSNSDEIYVLFINKLNLNYLQGLLHAILIIWEEKLNANFGPLPYLIILKLINLDGASPNNAAFIKELNACAPSDWFIRYVPKLYNDYSFLRPTLKRRLDEEQHNIQTSLPRRFS